MTTDSILIFIILGIALVLFISEKIRVDLVALMVLVSLTLTGLITPEEAFSGFASPAVITVWAVFIISGGLTRSGVADVIARFILRLAGTQSGSPDRTDHADGGRDVSFYEQYRRGSDLAAGSGQRGA